MQSREFKRQSLINSALRECTGVGDSPVFPRYGLYNIWLNTLTVSDIKSLIEWHVVRERRFVLANQNFHGLYIAHRDEKARRFFSEADYTHIDGTSLIVLGKLAGLPFRLEHRCGYMDLFPALLPLILERRWRVFYLGSRAEVLERALSRLRKRYPDLQIDGYHGYFDKQAGHPDNDRVIQKINHFKPNVLFVGMGMPIQEHWIQDHLSSIDAHAILHCGGLMDYIAGEILTPPRWLGPLGLEWAFRLMTEPARLWRRYLLEPIVMLPTLLRGTRRSRD